MLFDLRGKRKRVVQVIYAGLALLMGGGLIFFGIGSGLPGIFDSGSNGGGSASAAFQKKIKELEAKAQRSPKNEALRLQIARTYIQAGTSQIQTDPQTGQQQLTGDALKEFQKGADAWQRYLDLKPKKPDVTTAILASQAYFTLAQSEADFTSALADIDAAAEAQKIYAEAKPSIGSLGQLTVYLYLGGHFAEADRAAATVRKKLPSAQKSQFETQVAEAKRIGQQIQARIKASKAAQPKGQNPLQTPLGGGLGGLSGGTSGTP